ncbi:MAG TPA: VOC family protein [Blastocatellia bacterium]|nr:VOC family protein [Blastocatellia bacterium]
MSEVRRIPSGFHTITPTIFVRGAAQAMEFYKQAFGAEEISRHTTPDGGKVVHGELKVGDSHLFICDEFPEWGAQSPETLNGNSGAFYLYVENSDESFNRAVNAGAAIIRPVEETFWGDRVGVISDPYGHKWNFSTHVRDVTPEEMAAASAKFFSGDEQKADAAS